MIAVLNSCKDPFFNQALEEYVFRNMTGEDVFLLWQNQPCVVVGSFQNIHREVDTFALEKEHIAVVRRMTGGGAVYHDLGNFNYSLIFDCAETLDYDRCLEPMLATLRGMGLNVCRDRVCDIALDGKKISGSAQRLEKGRLLHHGTLLFQSDLQVLDRITTGNKNAFITSKGTESAICRVTNIADHLPEPMDADTFRMRLLDALVPDAGKRIVLGENERMEITRLMREKYQSHAWTWGRTPPYVYSREAVFCGKPIRIWYQARKGVITQADIRSEILLPEAGEKLVGCPIDPDSLRAACRRIAGDERKEELLRVLL